MKKDDRLLRVGVLGAGLIAQAAHLEACKKARNVELYALCDAAHDLRDRILREAWDEKQGALTGAFGAPDLDASVLLVSELEVPAPNGQPTEPGA